MLILSALNQCVSKYVWGCTQTHGSSFVMQFGKPSLEVREPRQSSSPDKVVAGLLSKRKVSVLGEVEILVLDCEWKVVTSQISSDHESSAEVIQQTLRVLDGEILTGCSVFELPSFGVELTFDLGSRVLLASRAGDESDLFSITINQKTYSANSVGELY